MVVVHAVPMSWDMFGSGMLIVLVGILRAVIVLRGPGRIGWAAPRPNRPATWFSIGGWSFWGACFALGAVLQHRGWWGLNALNAQIAFLGIIVMIVAEARLWTSRTPRATRTDAQRRDPRP